jgi:LuxR family maltose regulon positive regulatory protein
MSVSDILLATKLHIPPLHNSLVNRPRLIQRLNDGIAQGRRLILISAPAGYGKSTLLSDWVSQVGLPVAWLSLEKGENTPIRFWNYFITALDIIPHLHQAGIGESIFQMLQSPHPPPMDALLANLVNDFYKLEEPAVLVLDDLHVISEEQIHQDLIFLIDHLPLSTSGLHLVVASRMDPPWPLARWRVRDELNELRPRDLRFSYDETVQFLNQVLRLKLSSRDVAALQDRTEGWIAGLQMAAVSMQGRLKTQGSQGVSRFIATFTGSNRFILDYLMEEVISQQPAEIRDFLQQTSILEQLTAPLCDALTGRQDSQAILNQLEQANLFLIPLDNERQWYRYHHLFAELLRKRLKQTQPDRITRLHQLAGKWYAENNFLSKAISHALDAGDMVRVNEFVSGNALALVEQAELFDVLRHFEEMPEQSFLSKPWLCVAYAWVKAYADPSVEMDRVLQQTEQCLAGVENALERQHLTSHLAAIRSYIAWVKGEADKALEFAHSALENLPEEDWVTRCHVLTTQGLALQYLDNLPEAIQAIEAVVVAGQKAGKSQEILFASANLAFIYLMQGRLRKTFSLCQQILSLADETGQGLSHLPILANAYARMSMVQLEWNEVESAVSYARESVTLAEQWNQADTLHFTLTCLSEALCAAGDLEEAFAVNHRAMQLAVDVSPWFFRLSACDEVRLNLAKGDINAAAHRVVELEPLVDENSRRGTFLVTKVSLLNAQRNYPEVLAVLEEPICDLEERGLYWILMNLISFQALALQALGREEKALDVIGHCLALAAPEGYVRIFVKNGAPMARLLQIASSRGIETEYINKLLPAFNILVASHKSITPVHRLIEPISERELEVLRFLNTHLTIPEIAQEMVIAPSTIRTHVRNIYNKLDVHGRIEAIQKAKEFGLI